MTRLSALAGALLLLASSARALAADPLDCIPPSAHVVLVADSPRKAADTVLALDAFKQAQKLPQYRAVYDSPPAKRALQLLALFEKELGAKWPELLDQLGGNGVALGVQFGPDTAPAVLVLSGKDEDRTKKAMDLAIRTAEEEVARRGEKQQIEKKEVAGHEAVKLGDLLAVRVGAQVIVSNNEAMLKASALHAAADRAKSTPHKARKSAFAVLPKDPLAWMWIDFAALKKTQGVKDFFDTANDQIVLAVGAGATIDCLKRADFVAAGVYKEAGGFRFSLRIPAGREGLPAGSHLHVPPDGEPGSLPLLEPPGTIYSQSFYLGVGHLWKNREKQLNEKSRAEVENGIKQITKILPGNAKLSELLEMWGPYHRVVVANQDEMPYKRQPGTRLPAFGYVATGGAEFVKAVEPALRSAGLLASLQVGMKMKEYTHEGEKIVAYRFPEDKGLEGDAEGIRFNAEPCFAMVGDELVVASTVELCKKIVTALKSPKKEKGSPAEIRGKFSAKGGADFAKELAEPFITDAILGRGVGLDEAKREFADLLAWAKSLGTVQIELDIAAKQYKLDVVWEWK